MTTAMSSLARDLCRVIDWIVLDIDGTIIDSNDDGIVPTELAVALADFTRLGGQWMVATGRNLPLALEVLAASPGLPRPSYIVSVEQLLHRASPDGRYISFSEWNDATITALRTFFFDMRSVLPGLVDSIRSLFGDVLYADDLSPLCIASDSPEQLDRIERIVREQVGHNPEATFVRNETYGRLTRRTYHKGSATRYALAFEGIDPRRVLAAGNDLNDLELLRPEVAGHLIAPANAVRQVRDQVRAFGGTLTRRAAGRGVLDGMSLVASAEPLSLDGQ